MLPRPGILRPIRLLANRPVHQSWPKWASCAKHQEPADGGIQIVVQASAQAGRTMAEEAGRRVLEDLQQAGQPAQSLHHRRQHAGLLSLASLSQSIGVLEHQSQEEQTEGRPKVLPALPTESMAQQDRLEPMAGHRPPGEPQVPGELHQLLLNRRRDHLAARKGAPSGRAAAEKRCAADRPGTRAEAAAASSPSVGWPQTVAAWGGWVSTRHAAAFHGPAGPRPPRPGQGRTRGP